MIISQYEDKRFRLNGESGHGEIIYASRKMKQVMNIGWKAAATSSSVLIWGETGVGKEMIASGSPPDERSQREAVCGHQLRLHSR